MLISHQAGSEVRLTLKHYKAATPFLLRQFGKWEPSFWKLYQGDESSEMTTFNLSAHKSWTDVPIKENYLQNCRQNNFGCHNSLGTNGEKLVTDISSHDIRFCQNGWMLDPKKDISSLDRTLVQYNIGSPGHQLPLVQGMNYCPCG